MSTEQTFFARRVDRTDCLCTRDCFASSVNNFKVENMGHLIGPDTEFDSPIPCVTSYMPRSCQALRMPPPDFDLCTPESNRKPFKFGGSCKQIKLEPYISDVIYNPYVPGPTHKPYMPGPSRTSSMPGPSRTSSMPGPSRISSIPGPSSISSMPGPSHDPFMPGPSHKSSMSGSSYKPYLSGPSYKPYMPGSSYKPSMPGPSHRPPPSRSGPTMQVCRPWLDQSHMYSPKS